MKLSLIFCFFLSILFFVSCRKSTLEVESSSIYGAWVESKWDDNIQELQKVVGLDEHKYGFIIYADGRFVEHANSGGCKTPPIVYAKYEGNWNFISGDSLHIDVASWTGNLQYDLKIILIDKHKLEVCTYFFQN